METKGADPSPLVVRERMNGATVFTLGVWALAIVATAASFVSPEVLARMPLLSTHQEIQKGALVADSLLILRYLLP